MVKGRTTSCFYECAMLVLVNSFSFNSDEGFSGGHFWGFIFNFNKFDGVFWAMVGAESATYASLLQKNDSFRFAIMGSVVYVCFHRTDADTFSTLTAEFIVSLRKEV